MNKIKHFKELSDQELEKVTGGMITHATICDELTNPCDAGMRKSSINCQCEPMPNTIARKKVK